MLNERDKKFSIEKNGTDFVNEHYKVIKMLNSDINLDRIHHGGVACCRKIPGADGKALDPDRKVLDHNVPRPTSLDFVFHLRGGVWRR